MYESKNAFVEMNTREVMVTEHYMKNWSETTSHSCLLSWWAWKPVAWAQMELPFKRKGFIWTAVEYGWLGHKWRKVLWRIHCDNVSNSGEIGRSPGESPFYFLCVGQGALEQIHPQNGASSPLKHHCPSGIQWALAGPWQSRGEGVNLVPGCTRIHRSPRWTASGM